MAKICQQFDLESRCGRATKFSLITCQEKVKGL